jgi:hypothetical protein
MPPGPGRRYGVHFRRPGPGVTPLSSPLAPTLGCTKTAFEVRSAFPSVQHTEPGCAASSNAKAKAKAKEASASKFRARQFRHFGFLRAACRLTIRSSGRANGVPPGPVGRYGVHCLPSGPGVTPSSSPLAPTLGRRNNIAAPAGSQRERHRHSPYGARQ